MSDEKPTAGKPHELREALERSVVDSSKTWGAPGSKGLCARCGKPVILTPTESCWRSKGGKVWHEICSYQDQIEKLVLENEALKLAAQPHEPSTPPKAADRPSMAHGGPSYEMRIIEGHHQDGSFCYDDFCTERVRERAQPSTPPETFASKSQEKRIKAQRGEHPPTPGKQIISLEIFPETSLLANDAITVERRKGFNGVKWAVLKRGCCLNKSGEWEYEPIPSSRDDEFFARCRWDSIEEAKAAALACPSTQQTLDEVAAAIAKWPKWKRDRRIFTPEESEER